MQKTMLPVWLVLAVVVLLAGLVLAWVALRRRRFADQEEVHPEGYYMGLGLALGMGVGSLLGGWIGVLEGDPSRGLTLGPSAGLALGALFGVALERKYKDRLRPLTVEERRAQRIAFKVGVGVLAVVIAVCAALLWAR
jgi:hypothetical protein